MAPKKIQLLGKVAFNEAVFDLAIRGIADRNLLSRPTAKGHIHRIGRHFVPAGAPDTPAERRYLSKQRNVKLRLQRKQEMARRKRMHLNPATGKPGMKTKKKEAKND